MGVTTGNLQASLHFTTAKDPLGIVQIVTMDLEDARRRYHYSFTAEDHQRLPFYSALMTALENDLVAQVLLAGIRVEQRNPMLVLASLHLAALRGHPVLAPIYQAAREGSLSDPEAAARTVLGVVDDAIALGDQLMLTIVLNSYAVAYFSEEEQTAYFNDMIERCAQGNVAWISLESPFMVKFPTTSTESESARKGATEVLVTLPGSAPRHWGWCHHHGLWTEMDVPN
jgi:hypothetical protein